MLNIEKINKIVVLNPQRVPEGGSAEKKSKERKLVKRIKNKIYVRSFEISVVLFINFPIPPHVLQLLGQLVLIHIRLRPHSPESLHPGQSLY